MEFSPGRGRIQERYLSWEESGILTFAFLQPAPFFVQVSDAQVNMRVMRNKV
jgi:hypothetical protein